MLLVESTEEQNIAQPRVNSKNTCNRGINDKIGPLKNKHIIQAKFACCQRKLQMTDKDSMGVDKISPKNKEDN